MNKVYIVTYWDAGEEPVVTAFSNRDAADRCYRYFKIDHDGCCIDECNIYQDFYVHLVL